MPRVTIVNLRSKTIDCEVKTEKLLDILLTATDWMHSCGGKGKCTTCSAIIVSGADSLSKKTEAEERFLKLGKINDSMRLSCQCIVSGDVTVEVPEAYQLPHLNYS